jgi:hypothetical protein
MFRDAGPGFRIDCDYESRKLRVQEDVARAQGLVGYKPMWNDVASFATIEEWEQSKYAKLITDDQIDEMITWFWIDLTERSR